MRNLSVFLSCLAVCLCVDGCMLEQSKRGDKCPPDGTGKLAYIMEYVDGKIVQCKEGDGCYSDNFKFGSCPEEASHCLQAGDKKYYCFACEQGEILCDKKCVNPMDNSSYCGAKGACADNDVNSDNYVGMKCEEGYYCDQGVCKKSCNPGETTCLDGCFDTSNDLNHCGGCEKICNAQTNPNSTEFKCENGACKATACHSGYILQHGKCELCGTGDTEGFRYCAGQCLDVQKNMAHCGDCDKLCSTEKFENSVEVMCEDGHCIVVSCQSGYILKDNKCEVCVDDGLNGGKICSNSCVDVYSDKNHCGDCDIQCHTGLIENSSSVRCENGICVATACHDEYELKEGKCERCGEGETEGFKFCSGRCLDIQTDIYHCGDCDSPCQTDDFENSSEVSCESGVCVVKACDEGYILKDGQCISEVNCCGDACTNCASKHGWAEGECNEGVCHATKCKGMFVLNTKEGVPTCEIPVLENPSNCPAYWPVDCGKGRCCKNLSDCNSNEVVCITNAT